MNPVDSPFAPGAGARPPELAGREALHERIRVTSLGPTRSRLIAKGMIGSPSHGDTAFTVPLFHEFICRILPGDAWRT